MAVAVSFALLVGALVGSSSSVLAHLGLKDLLHHPLDDLTPGSQDRPKEPLAPIQRPPYDDQWFSSYSLSIG